MELIACPISSLKPSSVFIKLVHLLPPVNPDNACPYVLSWLLNKQLNLSIRLACVKHATSVHPEPGSNLFWRMYFCRCLNLVQFTLQVLCNN